MSQTSNLSNYAWADYLDCMDGLPEPMILPSNRAPPKPRYVPLMLGVAAAGLVTVAAIYVSELPFAPFTLTGDRHPIEPVMVAIIIGMIIANLLPLPKLLQPGLRFTIKRLLPIAVILLGARLDFVNILKVGFAGLGMSLLTIVAGIGLFLLFIRLGWVKYKLGLLLGIGTAICGGTAIVAAAPVIGADDKDVTFGVATVTLCGLVAMFLLPLAAGAMHMSEHAFGVWAGLSIHQTPQVIAAGFAYGNEAGDTATIVKLARVCLLAPALIVLGWLAARFDAPDGPQRRFRLRGLFPMFVVGFLLMALLKTLGLLPDVNLQIPGSTLFDARSIDFNLARLCETVSKLVIIAAMAAVGLETRFSALRHTGVRPLALGFAAAGIICAGILGLLFLTA